MLDLSLPKRRAASVLPVAVAFCLMPAALAAPPASPPDSFAPIPAPTVQALLGQVRGNPVVCKRYARYFHIPQTHLLAYLRANLVTSHLSDDGRYTMFCVRPNGLVYPAVLRMSKGSRVFALRGGPAVLSCPDGNPLARFQTAVETRILPPPATPPEAAPPRPIVVPLPPREIIVPAYVPTPVYQAVSPLTAAEQAPDAPTPPPTPPKP